MAGSSLDSLISLLNTRVADLQQLVIARNMYPASSVTDLSAVDVALKAMELQVQKIKDRLREETEAVPKAKKLIEASLRQQKKLESMSAHLPSYLPERMTLINQETSKCRMPETSKPEHGLRSLNLEEDPAVLPKEKKGRGSPPLWYITSEELDSLSSYMRGRLTLDKVNAAINDMSAYAEANAQLITAPRKKLAESMLDRALELRDIGGNEAVKGKYFFLETDVKGPSLKLDNTGKGILTVLRHLGRISETRIGHHRVIILLKPQ
ncbi:spindle and kinetochore-associated protein 1 homolog [Actinidia eriantha]|uniref:spindle and kinetochore-associated protein 1 homolog n=1 Tax=Actinidia eriantha TaxID=165200 RepID=UPI002588DC1D|nr:spindle and kinetochore-associated protein 1 homolog [Actinidia eriantha]XP_057510154.1 spindle and kinetochore-associated protein 1 homolog [Actinidia eriantha]XP_057510155.1 spindle and kinetochore-associated protein 1 homolog [Actinidia eriantha]